LPSIFGVNGNFLSKRLGFVGGEIEPVKHGDDVRANVTRLVALNICEQFCAAPLDCNEQWQRLGLHQFIDVADRPADACRSGPAGAESQIGHSGTTAGSRTDRALRCFLRSSPMRFFGRGIARNSFCIALFLANGRARCPF
jgi:hypothetical protein